MRYFLIALMCLLPVFSYAGEAKDLAEDPVLEKRMILLAEKVRCLVCQSEAVSSSHSEWSNDVRQIMREKMKEGMTDQQILDLLVERFGKSVLFDPPVDKETMPLWLAPFVLMLVGCTILVYQLRKRKGRVVEAELSAEDAQRAATLLNDSAATADSPKQANQSKDSQA
ncbi:MAG TPA: cytochrome c-type biogenesis protein [Gallionella sp.]|nr:cytochrome c-type biogenesis protein [Gallionella sp.]